MAVTRAEIFSRAVGLQPFQIGARRASRDRNSVLGDRIAGGIMEGGLFFLSPSTGEYGLTHATMPPRYAERRANGSYISDRGAVRRRDAKFLINSLSRLVAIDTPTMIGALKAAALVTAVTGNPLLGVAAGLGTKVAENFLIHKVSARNSRTV